MFLQDISDVDNNKYYCAANFGSPAVSSYSRSLSKILYGVNSASWSNVLLLHLASINMCMALQVWVRHIMVHEVLSFQVVERTQVYYLILV